MHYLWRMLPDYILEMIVPIRLPYSNVDREKQLNEWRRR